MTVSPGKPLHQLHFRVDTQDFYTFQEVLEGNCYQLPEHLPPDAVVVDIGANIGCFAMACLGRGAAFVDCWEPERENVDYLQRNLEPFAAHRSQVHPVAVWRSDQEEGAMYLLNKHPHTACHHLSADGMIVWTVGLDKVLKQFEKVYLLKMDCEGAEFPALQTCSQLHRVENITVEYHTKMNLSPDFPADKELLRGFLEGQGFQIREVPGKHHPDMVGVYFGTR
jgi:FkbM family methyltransferase